MMVFRSCCHRRSSRPSWPEATTFGEPGAGHVVAVFVSHSPPVTFRSERVAYWSWEGRDGDEPPAPLPPESEWLLACFEE
jgi:hypothetical protein